MPRSSATPDTFWRHSKTIDEIEHDEHAHTSTVMLRRNPHARPSSVSRFDHALEFVDQTGRMCDPP